MNNMINISVLGIIFGNGILVLLVVLIVVIILLCVNWICCNLVVNGEKLEVYFILVGLIYLVIGIMVIVILFFLLVGYIVLVKFLSYKLVWVCLVFFCLYLLIYFCVDLVESLFLFISSVGKVIK